MISVIVITRNSGRYLQRCLDSIFMQEITDLEIIAVDKDSQDDTRRILQNADNVTIIPQAGTGIANARNEGLRHCKGEFIAFLDSDDYWSPGKLKTQQQRLVEDPELLMITGHLVKENWGKRQEEKFVAMTPSAFLFRQTLFQQYGGFSESYRIASDHELLIRLQRKGIAFPVLDNIVVTKTIHEHNLSHHRILYREEMMNILRETSQ